MSNLSLRRYCGFKRTFTISLLTSVMLLLIGMQQAHSQAVKCPPNIDFSFGNLNNWYSYAGQVVPGACPTCPSVSDPSNPIIFTGAITGGGSTPASGYPYFSGRHNVTTGTNVDPYGFFPQVCPGGGAASAMVGNDDIGAEGERIRYYVHVPVGFNNYSFGFEYATVLENPGHSFPEQPAFFVRGYDSATGAPIQCATLTYVSDASLPGFASSSVRSQTLYLPWTKGTLNLSGQGGKTIIVEVESHDCTATGHFGYGYFDIVSCGQFNAAITKCDLSAGTVTLSAPLGYKTYSWFKGPTIAGAPVKSGSTVTVPAPTTSTFYYCVLVPYNSNGCPDTIRTIPFVDFGINATPDTVCNSLGKPIQLDVNVISGGAPGATYYYSWLANPTLSATNIK
ncbi:MAG: hypothetical protein JST36_05155, partial [Bacteroidetes bacterium]|nr:hypothetical protein [Bacteroidota bacterium]